MRAKKASAIEKRIVKALENLSDSEVQVYGAIVDLGGEPHLGKIIARAFKRMKRKGKPDEEFGWMISAALLVLEIRRLIRQLPGKRFKLYAGASPGQRANRGKKKKRASKPFRYWVRSDWLVTSREGLEHLYEIMPLKRGEYSPAGQKEHRTIEAARRSIEYWKGRKPQPVGPTTKVMDLHTRRYIGEYDLDPREAVIAAYAQHEMKDWDTQDYEEKYGGLVKRRKHTVAVGDYAAFLE